MEQKHCPMLLTSDVAKTVYNTCRGVECAAFDTRRETHPDPKAEVCEGCAERCAHTYMIRLRGRCGLSTGDFFTVAEIIEEGYPECGTWEGKVDA